MMNINVINEKLGAVQHPDYSNEILGIVRSNLAPKLLKEKLLAYHENDIAAALELMSRDERGRSTVFSTARHWPPYWSIQTI